MRTLFILLAWILVPATLFAQADSVVLSEPIDLPLEGWNKVIQAPNGNTLLFHIRPNRSILVQVYDTTAKVVATQKHLCKEFDVAAITKTRFESLQITGDEVSLFLQQEQYGKVNLFRLRFNSSTGALIEEKSLAKAAAFWVLKDPTGGYSILLLRSTESRYHGPTGVQQYDAAHNLKRQMDFDENAGEFASMKITGTRIESANIDDEGTLFFTFTMYSLKAAAGLKQDENSVHQLINVKLGREDSNFLYQFTQLPKNVYANYGFSCLSKTSATQRQFLVTHTNYLYEAGLNRKIRTLYNGFYGVYSNSEMRQLGMRQFLCEDAVLQEGESENAQRLRGFPIKLLSTPSGTSLLVSQEHKILEDNARTQWNQKTILGDITLINLKSNGTAAWEVRIPRNQAFDAFIHPLMLARRECDGSLSESLFGNVFNEHFVSFDCVTAANGWNVIYNQDEFEKPTDPKLPSVCDLRRGHGVVCRVTEDGTMTQSALFGTCGTDESKAVMVETGHYDPIRKRYAALVLHRTGKQQQLKLAWQTM